MSTLFPPILEKRYVDYPRRYTVEYHVQHRSKLPDVKGRCITLASAKIRAIRAIELGYCEVVRIFDHKIGQTLLTYKNSVDGIHRSEGYIR